MKRYFLFLIIASFLTPVFYSCKKNEKQLMKKAHELAINLLQDEYVFADSVAILKVEKVTAMRYAEIVFEMMETMEQEYNILYREAIFSGEIEKAENLEQNREKVTEMKEFCLVGITSNLFDDKEIILYMVQFTSYEEDYTENGYFLMTPKFSLHDFDPFGNNLLKLSAY